MNNAKKLAKTLRLFYEDHVKDAVLDVESVWDELYEESLEMKFEPDRLKEESQKVVDSQRPLNGRQSFQELFAYLLDELKIEKKHFADIAQLDKNLIEGIDTGGFRSQIKELSNAKAIGDLLRFLRINITEWISTCLPILQSRPAIESEMALISLSVNEDDSLLGIGEEETLQFNRTVQAIQKILKNTKDADLVR